MPTGRENAHSKIITIRLPHELLATLKKLARKLDLPYQAIMKEAIREGLPALQNRSPAVKEPAKKKRTKKADGQPYKAPHVQAALAKLKKPK